MKTLCMTLVCAFLSAGDYGIVNFATCLSDSKKGKQEQASFEALKKQVGSMIEETEKNYTAESQKLNDSEYMDGLSPEAEQEQKMKVARLEEEMARYQNQYYQVMQQANMRILQQVGQEISAASEKVAKDKKLNMIINKDASCFYYKPDLDVTKDVIKEMDNRFDAANKTPSSTETK